MDDKGFENCESEIEVEHINPVAPETLDYKDNELLRGDAIGDTAYTHRWVLSCLLTIIKNLQKYIKGLESATQSVDGGSSTLSLTDQQQSWRQAVLTKDLANTSHGSAMSLESLSSSGKISELDVQSEKCANKSVNQEPSNNESGSLDSDKSVEDQEDSSETAESDKKTDVLELDEDTEEAACQLWDMTVEKDVTLHLLNLSELDVLQLASQILSHSRAPRLTEVVTGIVANLCCQKEGCEMIFEDKNGVLEATLDLLLTTSDIPTLCEVIRLIKLLLWHRLNRTPTEARTTCPLLLAMQGKPISEALIFLASNCLNDNLITSLFELFESLLFVKLPSQSNSMSDYYATEEMLNYLTGVLIKHSSSSEDNFSKTNNDLHLHKSVTCLYSFIDTPIIALLQHKEQENEYLLPHLCSYIEKLGNTNSANELIGEVSEKIISAIGLCQILIPYLRHGRIIRVVSHLLALTRGHGHHYTASRSNSTEDDAQYMDGDPGWMSPVTNVLSTCPGPVNKSMSEDSLDECISDLADLDDTLCDYCGELFNWWWQLEKPRKDCIIKTSLIKKLDECHANEVILTFKAVRSRKPSVVSRLQEYLLDKGTHGRLVQLLAHMYQ